MLSIQQNGVSINKVFNFKRGDYLVDVGYEVNNNTDTSWQANFYAQFKRDRSIDPSSMEAMGMASYLGGAVTRPTENYFKIDFDDMDEGSFKEQVTGGWAAFLQHYFLGAWVPKAESAHTYNARNAVGPYIIGYYDEALTVAPGTKGETSTSI